MGALDVLHSQAATAEHWLDRVPGDTVTAAVYSPAGELLASPAVTIDALSVPVSAFAAPQTLTVTERTAVVDGERYILRRSALMQSAVRVESGGGLLGAGALLLSSAPHFTPAAGDVLRGCKLSCTIPALTTRGTNYRVEWAGTDLEGRPFRPQTIFHVVRTLFVDPLTPTDVLEYVSTLEGSKGKRLQATPQRLVDLARRANDLLRLHLTASAHYPHLIGDPSAFREAGWVALRFVLLDQAGLAGETPNGLTESRADVLRDLAAAVELGVQGMGWYDRDDSASVDEPEEVGPITLRWRR